MYMKKRIFGSIVVAIVCLVLVGCSKGEKKNYTFNSDGTGKYDAAGTIMKFTYTLKGDKISIQYEGENMESFDTKYSIDGNTLNVVDSLGHDTLYKKIK